MLTMKLPCLQEMPLSEPVEQSDEDVCDTVGEATEGSRSPAPTVEELLAQLELLRKRQRPQRRRKRRLSRRDWSTLPAFSAPQS
jgi:hypothetical protein